MQETDFSDLMAAIELGNTLAKAQGVNLDLGLEAAAAELGLPPVSREQQALCAGYIIDFSSRTLL